MKVNYQTPASPVDHLPVLETSTGSSFVMYWVLQVAPIIFAPVASLHRFDMLCPV